MPDATVRLTEIGWIAHDALARTGGRAHVTASLTRSAYLDAGGELIWLADAAAPRHGRASIADSSVAWPPVGQAIVLDVANAAVWRPEHVPTAEARVVADGARALLARIDDVGIARGLATLLVDQPLVFPIDRVAPAARALATASLDDDTDAAIRAAADLRGVGPGLTPAGDDFVGGLFFTRVVLSAGPVQERWRDAGAMVAERARHVTHPVSAVLLGDLVSGRAHEPLHGLARALAVGASPTTLIDAARRLARLGHSSGWDMLAGVVLSVAEPACWHPGCIPPG